jgi:hypothetical protein
MGVTERKLWTQGKIGKRRVVDSIREALFAAAPVDARIEITPTQRLKSWVRLAPTPRGFDSKRLLTGSIAPGRTP